MRPHLPSLELVLEEARAERHGRTGSCTTSHETNVDNNDPRSRPAPVRRDRRSNPSPSRAPDMLGRRAKAPAVGPQLRGEPRHHPEIEPAELDPEASRSYSRPSVVDPVLLRSSGSPPRGSPRTSTPRPWALTSSAPDSSWRRTRSADASRTTPDSPVSSPPPVGPPRRGLPRAGRPGSYVTGHCESPSEPAEDLRRGSRIRRRPSERIAARPPPGPAPPGAPPGRRGAPERQVGRKASSYVPLR